VPAAVAAIVATRAINKLFKVASARGASLSAAAYQRREKPSHSVRREELKLNTESTRSGA
jgi:hypothetical protein